MYLDFPVRRKRNHLAKINNKDRTQIDILSADGDERKYIFLELVCFDHFARWLVYSLVE